MRELDQPALEACGDPMGMPSPPSTPPPTPPSMSVNLNAQGMDNIESLLKLMTKVNPDMINQPSPMASAPMPMPIPSISSIKPELPPLKMLPDFDKEEPKEMPFGGPSGINSPDKGPMDMDGGNDNMPGGEKDSGAQPAGLGASLDRDGDGDHDMDDHDMEKDSDDETDDDKKKETYANEPDQRERSVDYMNNQLAGGMNRPKDTFPKVADGDNPMQRVKEGGDLRAQIRAELLQRLAEAKGA